MYCFVFVFAQYIHIVASKMSYFFDISNEASTYVYVYTNYTLNILLLLNKIQISNIVTVQKHYPFPFAASTSENKVKCLGISCIVYMYICI